MEFKHLCRVIRRRQADSGNQIWLKLTAGVLGLKMNSIETEHQGNTKTTQHLMEGKPTPNPNPSKLLSSNQLFSLYQWQSQPGCILLLRCAYAEPRGIIFPPEAISDRWPTSQLARLPHYGQRAKRRREDCHAWPSKGQNCAVDIDTGSQRIPSPFH